MLKLLYPISTELFTFVHLFNRTIERSLRSECNLSVVQYRILSCLKEASELPEAQIAQILSVSPSQLSQGLAPLAGNGYIQSRTNHGPSKTIRLMRAGRRLLREADLVLVEACNQVFEPLGADLGDAIRAGSMLTNQRHGIVRIENGDFFAEHACFEAFLEAERITKNSTQAFDLTETEFRVLFELYSSGPSSKSQLAKMLRCTPSVITDTCRQLNRRRLIASEVQLSDRRSHVVSLTREGRALTEDAAVHVDERAYVDIRPSSDGERSLYQQMANIVTHRT